MKKILVALMIGALVIGLVGAGALASFSDTESSTNTFTAGTLDLTVNDQNGQTVQFSWSNLKPGDQPHQKYTLKNIGSVPGYLDIENITVESSENDLTEPEQEAGDTSADTGELDDVLNL
ncbi:MAG: CalY family protein, partial [Dehalococcoidales bacterium]|nr:CalY family protein [Dehalococcoidales bacterium]